MEAIAVSSLSLSGDPEATFTPIIKLSANVFIDGSSIVLGITITSFVIGDNSYVVASPAMHKGTSQYVSCIEEEEEEQRRVIREYPALLEGEKWSVTGENTSAGAMTVTVTISDAGQSSVFAD